MDIHLSNERLTNFAEWKTLPMETVISINTWMGTFAEVFKNNRKPLRNDDTVISY